EPELRAERFATRPPAQAQHGEVGPGGGSMGPQQGGILDPGERDDERLSALLATEEDASGRAPEIAHARLPPSRRQDGRAVREPGAVVEGTRSVEEALRGRLEIRQRRAEHRAMPRPQPAGTHENESGG